MSPHALTSFAYPYRNVLFREKNIGKHGWCFPTNYATKVWLLMTVCRPNDMNIF